MVYKRPVWAEIDHSAIEKNIQTIKNTLEDTTLFMAVVKANAYGHGMIEVAKTAVAAGADRLGVALLEEAVALRDAGIKVPVQVLSEIPQSGVADALDSDIMLSIYTEAMLDKVKDEAIRRRKKVKVHLKVDTGMNRAGAKPKEARSLYEQIINDEYIELEGVFTHFAVADDPSETFTSKQLDELLKLKKDFKADLIWHAANSAATLFFPESQLDMVRIGIALYGLQPSHVLKSKIELVPALSLKAKIALVKDLKEGDGLSYGLTYRAGRDHLVGVLPIGYADGYSRILSNRSEVLIQGIRSPVIGRVCMDQLLVAIPDDIQLLDSEVITLIGRDNGECITAEELGDIMGTINYEIICSISERVPRIDLRSDT